MARKFCPVCNHLNGGSAVDCVCGHVFAASTVVVPKKTKTCPKCLHEQPKLLETCDCGHTFVDIEDRRIDLEILLGKGSTRLVLGVALFVVSALLTISLKGVLLLLISPFFGVYLVIQGLVMRADARTGLRELAGAKASLLPAKLLS